MAEDLARGKTMLRSEGYEVLEATAMGDHVALQVKWTGVFISPSAHYSGDSMIYETESS